ncbi:MAG: hypothetical protein ACRDIC_13940 [bacterium]
MKARKQPPVGPRPDVVAEFVYTQGRLFLSVRNIGPSPARSVVIRFKPPIRGAHGAFSRLRVFQGTAFLGPGRELTLFVDSAVAYFNSNQPKHVTTRVSWEDESGAAFSRISEHDLEIYREFPEAL